MRKLTIIFIYVVLALSTLNSYENTLERKLLGMTILGIADARFVYQKNF